jgi:hypothetical protein
MYYQVNGRFRVYEKVAGGGRVQTVIEYGYVHFVRVMEKAKP